MCINLLLTGADREDALRDDFEFGGSYDYTEEEEWADEEANWDGQEETAQQTETSTEVKDEGAAYLDFLNEEVSTMAPYTAPTDPCRPRSSAAPLTMMRRATLAKTTFWTLRSTRLSLTSCSRVHY